MEKQKNRAAAATSWAGREVDHLFVAVARYTRFVLFSKWFLGLFAVVLMGGLIAWPLIGKDKAGLRVSFVSSDPAQKAASPQMLSPHYIGNDEKGQRYSITGTRAVQQTPQLVRIEQTDGQLIKVDGSVVAVRADVGLFHQDTKIVELSGNVNLFNDKGTIFVTPSATVNTVTMDADGAEHIEGTGPNGKLVATGFKIRNKGNSIFFGTTPGVHVHIEKMKQES